MSMMAHRRAFNFAIDALIRPSMMPVNPSHAPGALMIRLILCVVILCGTIRAADVDDVSKDFDAAVAKIREKDAVAGISLMRAAVARVAKATGENSPPHAAALFQFATVY